MKINKLIGMIALLACSGFASAQLKRIDTPYEPVAPTTVSPSLPSKVTQTVDIAAAPAQSPPPVAVKQPDAFEVSPSDVNFRVALKRWASIVGWSFTDEQWTIDRDIPVMGSASLGSDFKAAVRSLLASTAQIDIQVKGCFSGNNVLRVVPENEICNRQLAK